MESRPQGEPKNTSEDVTNLPTTAFDPIDLLPDEPIPLAVMLNYRAKGLTYAEIGTLCGCTKQNIHIRLQPVISQVRGLKEFKDHRADMLAAVGKVGIEVYLSLTREEQKKLMMKRGLTDMGIAWDKERLERDLATSYVVTVIADIEALREARNK